MLEERGSTAARVLERAGDDPGESRVRLPAERSNAGDQWFCRVAKRDSADESGEETGDGTGTTETEGRETLKRLEGKRTGSPGDGRRARTEE